MDNHIIELETSKLIPNPHNPRKDLGDITELSESIQAKGIMQNLTVIPQSEGSDKYIVLIGHRRLAAAQAAGIKTVPCKIIDNMPIADQIGIMLLENIQRNDLTIPEQAQSFQMMLDLGDTVEGIAHKTGFAKTTVRHRLNIAKLDQEVLEKKLNDNNHQITLKDLIALEQVQDLDKRNEILSNCYDSRDIARRANEAAKEETRNHLANVIYKHLERQGIKPLPDAENQRSWDSRWKKIKTISLDESGDRFSEIEGLTPAKSFLDTAKLDDLPVYYVRWSYTNSVDVIADKGEDHEPEVREKTPKDIEREERGKCRQAIISRIERMDQEREDFLHGLIEKKIEDNDTPENRDYFWLQLLRSNADISLDELYDFCFEDLEKPEDEKESFVLHLSPCLQMLILLHQNLSSAWQLPVDFKGEYDEERARPFQSVYMCLEEYGFKLDREDTGIIYGTSSLYYQPDTDDEED